AGDFAGALRIIESGDAYVNVHTVNFPGGEIRGEVKSED
ncbi:MAG: CHRD domain-containing protein, partial [Chloroflexi bacterium]